MKTKRLEVIMIYLLAIFCLLTSFFNISINVAHAEAINYSSVLEDLQKDEDFNVANYPVNKADGSLQVIHVAESVNDELFVYVYQPSADEEIVATTIRISTDYVGEISPVDYKLSLLDSEGVFFKYKVEGLELLSDEVRFYDITAIHRKWNSKFDEAAEGDNTIDEVAFEVAQLWTVYETNGTVIYNCLQTEVITITDKHVGFLRYTNGWAWVTYYCDSHYVAFSTDKPMDKVVEAELSFVTYDYTTLYDAPVIDPEERDKTKDVQRHVELTNDEWVENQRIGLFGSQYDWCRIESISTFLEEDLTDETKEAVSDKQWVLRFYETEYTHSGGNLGNAIGSGTGVAEVTVLRLKFETDGVTYNLGVVDNKQSGDTRADNYVQHPSIWWIIVAVVILLLLLPFLPSIIKFIFKCVTWILKGLWWLITIPFEILKDNDKNGGGK